MGHAHGPTWARAFHANPSCDLVAVYDHEPERARQLAETLGCALTDDLSEFLDRTGLDAVAITSEHSLHRGQIERAAEAGLAILCEKPLATTLEAADAATAAVERSGVRFMQGFQMRLDPANQEVRRIVQEGRIGRISSVMKRHSHYFGLSGWPDDSGAWFFDPGISGGGAGLDEMIHTCDWLRWIFGEPASVTAVASSKTLGRATEDLIVAVFTMRSGAVATLISSWTDTAGAATTHISGDAGTILEHYTDLASSRCDKLVDASVVLQREPRLTWEHLPVKHSFPDVHPAVADEFVRCLITGDPFPSSIDDGRLALAMVLAAYESAGTGTVVQLSTNSIGATTHE